MPLPRRKGHKKPVVSEEQEISLPDIDELVEKPVQPKRTRRAKPARNKPEANDDTEPKLGYIDDGYKGKGYPKGMGHGPRVNAWKKGKIVQFEGMAYEELPKKWQEIVDKKPYDDAGQLRIFIRNKGDARGHAPFYEYGSNNHASKLKEQLESRTDDIFNKKVDISWVTRPPIDSVDGSKERHFPDKDNK